MNDMTERNGWFRDKFPPPQHIVQVHWDDGVTSARLLAFRDFGDWVNWEDGRRLENAHVIAWAERGDV